MKSVCILKCDQIREETRSLYPDYDQMFVDLFQDYSKEKLQFCSYHCFENQFPESLEDHYLYIITGSHHSCYEKLDWIEKLKELVKRIYIQRKFLLGICFGHQIVAEALNGKVERSPKGWGLGLHHYELCESFFLDQSLEKNFSLLVSHQDQVVVLPQEAYRLGGNSFCPNAFFKVGKCFLCLQPHPEFSVSYSKFLLEIRRKEGIFSEEIYQKTLDRYDEKQPDLDLVMNWICRFFRLQFNSSN